MLRDERHTGGRQGGNDDGRPEEDDLFAAHRFARKTPVPSWLIQPRVPQRRGLRRFAPPLAVATAGVCGVVAGIALGAIVGLVGIVAGVLLGIVIGLVVGDVMDREDAWRTERINELDAIPSTPWQAGKPRREVRADLSGSDFNEWLTPPPPPTSGAAL